MGFMDFVINYLVPIVGGFFFLLFLSGMAWAMHRFVLKPLGFYTLIQNWLISRQRSKILGDEKVIEYCVTRINKKWTVEQVKEELLLSNKYTMGKINQMLWAFNEIKKEMETESKNPSSEDLP